MARTTAAVPPQKVTRDDLERKFKSLQDGLTGKLEEKRRTLLVAGGAAALLVALVIYKLGRRSGKKQTTLVEIRRL